MMFYSANPAVQAYEAPARRARAQVIAGLARRLLRGSVKLTRRLVPARPRRTATRQACNG